MARKMLGKFRFIKQIFAALALLMVFGCAKDEGIVSNLDTDLTNALLAVSEGDGLDYYILPASTDYQAIPQDPANLLTAEKVELGKMLFHEPGLSSNTIQSEGLLKFSCASCHHFKAGFQAGVRQSIGDGGVGFGIKGEARERSAFYSANEADAPHIKSPTIMNSAYQANMLWNGQFGAGGENIGTEDVWTPNTPKDDNFLGYEGIETQAIAAQSVHRMEAESSLIMNNPEYKAMFAAAFPGEPISELNVGLAMAAYERVVLANEAPFQEWLKGNKAAMSADEKEGAILFFTKAKCYECHSGPALNSMAFYALGMKDMVGPEIFGVDVKDDAKNGRGGFTKKSEDLYKFKVPQLYNLKDSPFYGHGGSFTTISSVIRYKNNARSENGNIDASRLPPEFVPLELTDNEIEKLTLFITNSLYDPNLERYVPATIPSGLCFPNNDQQSKLDLGCN